MFLFTHGNADYTAELILPNQVQLARRAEIDHEHPGQSVTQYHVLTFPETVYNVCMNVAEDTVDIQLANDHEDSYSFGEIEGFFTGEDGEPVIHYTTSDSLFTDDKAFEHYMPNHKWDSKYVEKFLKHNEQDNVNHPAHYQSKSGLEAIDVIKAFTEDLVGIEAVCTGNALKYLCRWKHKNGVEDLKKAKWYIQRLIDIKEADK